MARILLVDPSETARRAMNGILARGSHKLATVDTAAQGWEFLHRNPGVDLVFTELKLTGGGGLAFVEQLKGDPLLQLLPVVIYTADGNRDAVRQAVGLQVQNFLIKPYHDDDIFAEIAKSVANPWRNRHFEEEKSFCKLMGYTPAELHKMLEDLLLALGSLGEQLVKCAETADNRAVAELIDPLRETAEAAGAWCLVECLQRISARAMEGQWSAWSSALEPLNLCALLIAGRIDPERDLAPDFSAPVEIITHPEVAEQTAWLAAPEENRCPLLSLEKLQRAIDALPGCPVIGSAAASFQMVANGHPSCINPLMDLVARDPGLSAQMLVAANKVRPPTAEDGDRIEDARLAVGLLGEQRLEQQARNLIVVEERIMDLPPAFNWTRYWTYQRGVARIAQIICRDLEFDSLESTARVAGQLYDIGKLLLAHLHPGGFRAIMEHARLHRLPLREVEKLYLGCTTKQLGAYFGQRFGLSNRFIHVMSWIDNPAAATKDANLVAILSLARDLCRHNQVGASGDPAAENLKPIQDSAEWHILRESVYPSFNLQKFEQQIHAHCVRLRTELSGQQSGTVAQLAANAAV
jgi:CheY-like chemotaxis protein/HD-like signal output (HDOD) protein